MRLFKRSPNGIMLNIGNDERTSKWYTVDGSLLEKSKTIPDGAEVTMDARSISGVYHLTYLEVGTHPIPAPATPEPVAAEPSTQPKKPQCADCGTTMKDDKYETCYDCSMKRREKKGDKFDSETSVKQTCAHAASRTLIALQGQVNESNIEQLAEKLYKKFYTLLTQ